MRPIDLPDYNITLTKPDSMTYEQCAPLTAWHGNNASGDHCFVTAWVPNKEDLEQLNKGLPIYIQTVSDYFPPIAVFTMNEDGTSND